MRVTIDMYINNIFTLGFRCNADDFTRYLQIRKYSSPFSYMVIDIKTALSFIENKFEDYTTNIIPGKKTYKFNKNDWSCNNIHTCSVITHDYVDILDMDKVCIWNHHDLYDKNTVYSINRRSLHLLDCLSKKPDTTLLFYIEKIQNYEGNDKCYFDKNILDKYDYKFLILLPLLNFNSAPLLFYDNSRVRIIYFNSNLEGNATDISSHVEEWAKLRILVNRLYDFNIEESP